MSRKVVGFAGVFGLAAKGPGTPRNEHVDAKTLQTRREQSDVKAGNVGKRGQHAQKRKGHCPLEQENASFGRCSTMGTRVRAPRPRRWASTTMVHGVGWEQMGVGSPAPPIGDVDRWRLKRRWRMEMMEKARASCSQTHHGTPTSKVDGRARLDGRDVLGVPHRVQSPSSSE